MRTRLALLALAVTLAPGLALAQGEAHLHVHEGRFVPERLAVEPGQVVLVLNLHGRDGSRAHTVTADDGAFHVDLAPPPIDGFTDASFRAPVPGEYPFGSRAPGDEAMRGLLVVGAPPARETPLDAALALSAFALGAIGWRARSGR